MYQYTQLSSRVTHLYINVMASITFWDELHVYVCEIITFYISINIYTRNMNAISRLSFQLANI